MDKLQTPSIDELITLSDDIAEGKRLAFSSTWAIVTPEGEIKDTFRPVLTPEARLDLALAKESEALDKLNHKGLVKFKRSADALFIKYYTAKVLPYENYTYIGYMSKLLCCISPTTNAICKQRAYRGRYIPMNPSDMAEFLRISVRTIHRFIKESIELGIIAQVTINSSSSKLTYFICNPAYFQNGTELRWEVLNAFMNDKAFREVLEEHHLRQFEKALDIEDAELVI